MSRRKEKSQGRLKLKRNGSRELRLIGTALVKEVARYPVWIVGRNPGDRRALVACSKAKARRSNLGSLQARPKNEIPTGNPEMEPAGPVMLGSPATAAGEVLPPSPWSPVSQSVKCAGAEVGATMASRLSLTITAS